MDFLQDLKFGLRMMRRSPGFTAVAVLVLTLGIGGTAAMFGIINTLVWRPIAAKEPARLVRVYSKDKKPTGGYRGFSYPNFTEVREKNSAFTDVAAFGVCMVGVNEGDLIRKTFYIPGFRQLLRHLRRALAGWTRLSARRGKARQRDSGSHRQP